MTRRGLAASAAFLVAASSAPALASETSGTNYPLGVNTATSSIYPAPGGTEFFNYDVIYSSSVQKADAGNPRLPQFDLFVFAEAVKVNHTWASITKDVTIGSGFAALFTTQTLNIPGLRTNTGLQFANPDLIVYNVAYHPKPNLFIAHQLNVFPKWGQYDKARLLNAGNGYATIAPSLGVTWLPGRFEVNVDGHVDFNTRNKATGYRSGDDVTIDYGIGYRPLKRTPALQVGLNGYFLKQIGDDRIGGARVGNGNRGQVFAIGPSVRYDITRAAGLIVKWQHETAVENRLQGERLWFEFAFPF